MPLSERRCGLRTLSAQVLFVSVLLLSVSLPCGAAEPPNELAIVGARIYPAPTVDAISDGVVVIRDGKIVAVGARGKVKIPKKAQALNGAGLVVTAGFWNCHVHFTGLQWADAARQPAQRLKSQLQQMLTRYGFTTVFDIASLLENTNALRKRVEAGEVPGPKIYTTGEPLFPKDGIPAYVKQKLPELAPHLPQVENAEQARNLVRHHVTSGADAIKIFAGSWLGDDHTVEMPLEIVKAVTAEAHRLGKPVFAHPQTLRGVENAVAGGVDILAHTAPSAGAWPPDLVDRMRRSNVALIPTLTLWRVDIEPAALEPFMNAAVAQLRAFGAAGGQVLFGTDVGYIPEYDTSEEYELLARGGLDWRQILASLTTLPVRRFSQWNTGRVAPGQDADLVVLAADPAVDVRAFAKVKFTIRGGRILYSSTGP